MIEAGKFAKPTVATGDGKFLRFAISTENAVSELRRLADAVENGQILLQKIQTGQVAAPDDFYLQAIMIEFAEREELEKVSGPSIKKDVVGLYADDRKFPVAIGDLHDR